MLKGFLIYFQAGRYNVRARCGEISDLSAVSDSRHDDLCLEVILSVDLNDLLYIIAAVTGLLFPADERGYELGAQLAGHDSLRR